MHKPGNVCTQTKASSWNGRLNDSTHSRTPAHNKGIVASLRNTRVGTAPSSCIPSVASLDKEVPSKFCKSSRSGCHIRTGSALRRSVLFKCCCIYSSMEEEFVEPPDELRIEDDDIEVCFSV